MADSDLDIYDHSLPNDPDLFVSVCRRNLDYVERSEVGN